MTLDVLKWTIASYFEATGKVLPDLPDVLGPYDGETLVGKSVRVGATQIEFWDAGVIAVEPDQPGDKDVIFSCAVHGDETAPIEIVRDMLTDILAGKLQVTHRTLFLIANPAAIVNGTRFIDVNMNRLFSGAHKQGNTPEHRRAAKLEQYVTRFYQQQRRYHYDLHTAIRDSAHEKFAVYPFTHGGPYKMEQLTYLAECGVDTILLNQAPTTTFSYYSVREHQADAFTVELGKVRPFGENDMSRFADADAMFRKLISTTEIDLPAFDSNRHHVYDVSRSIDRTAEDFRLNFADDVANFTEFELGHLLAVDGENEYTVEQPGERIIFPNAKVALGQRALLTVVPMPVENLKLV
ncbi:succinylglutamate desuccinylase [Pseudidiomarina tainanensis]|uniref:succinylglutamate desuccinylase n=1 Tax=Pseudidiomarina tainanensis TaxID=502365 RepID=UPI002D78CD6D|nr:succinylglutamate desuccinylase [Pseudidiomarina tainanensis]